jgi:hypothetical protein
MSAAELLRQAADALRSAVAALPVRVQATWEADGAEIYATGMDDSWVGESLTEAPDDGVWVSAYIALMHPSVALALAAWLEKSALIVSTYDGEILARVEQIAMEPLAVARAILREPEVAG